MIKIINNKLVIQKTYVGIYTVINKLYSKLVVSIGVMYFPKADIHLLLPRSGDRYHVLDIGTPSSSVSYYII